MKAIYRFVGMQYRDAVDFVAGLPRDEPMTLVREPDNAFDHNAIQVLARGRHVGFILAKQARSLAKRMDKAKGEFIGKLVPGTWPEIELEE